MNRVYFQIFQLVVQVVLAGLLFRAKKRSDGLPAAARKDRNYSLNAAIVATGIAFLCGVLLLVSAISSARAPATTP